MYIPVQPICTFSCTSVFLLIFINPQYTVLHILSHCTSYSFYFIICSLFHSHLLFIYIYSLVLCSLFYCLCYFYFISILLLLLYIYIFFALSIERPVRPTFTTDIPCMIVYVTNIKNLEPVNICMEPFFYKPLLQAPAVNKSFKLKNILICKNESYNAGEIKVLRLTEWFVFYGDFFLHCSSIRMLTGGS